MRVDEERAGLPDLARHEAASPPQEDSSRSAHDTAVQMSSPSGGGPPLATSPNEGPGEKRVVHARMAIACLLLFLFSHPNSRGEAHSLTAKPRRRGKRGAYACGRGSGPGLPDLVRHEAASPRQGDSSRSVRADRGSDVFARGGGQPLANLAKRRARRKASSFTCVWRSLASSSSPSLLPTTPAKSRAPPAETYQNSARNPPRAR
jgi:hypothetical protein